MTDLVWDGKYLDGRKSATVRIALPFRTVEMVNESAPERQRILDLLTTGQDPESRDRLIWGDNKCVLSSLMPSFRRLKRPDLRTNNLRPRFQFVPCVCPA